MVVKHGCKTKKEENILVVLKMWCQKKFKCTERKTNKEVLDLVKEKKEL